MRSIAVTSASALWLRLLSAACAAASCSCLSTHLITSTFYDGITVFLPSTYLTHLELEKTSFLLHLLGDFSSSDLSADHPVLLGVFSLLLLYLCTGTEERTNHAPHLQVCVLSAFHGGLYVSSWMNQYLIHHSVYYNEQDGATTLTTLFRSPSMLYQRASLCPANTQVDKHQQLTEVTVGAVLGFFYYRVGSLPRTQQTSHCAHDLCHRRQASDHATPLHAPLTLKVRDTLSKHNTKTVFVSGRFTVIVLTEKVLPTPPSLSLMWLFLTHMHRSWGMTTEMCWWSIYFPLLHSCNMSRRGAEESGKWGEEKN